MSAAALWAAHRTSHLPPPTARQNPTQPASLPSSVSACNPVASLPLTASACRLPPAAHRSPPPLAPAARSPPAPPSAFQAGARTIGRRVGRGTQSVRLQLRHLPPDVCRPLHPARRLPLPLAARAPCTLRPRLAGRLAGGGSDMERRVWGGWWATSGKTGSGAAGGRGERQRGGMGGTNSEGLQWGGGVAGRYSASHTQPTARAVGVNPRATRLQVDRACSRRCRDGRAAGMTCRKMGFGPIKMGLGPSKWDWGSPSPTVFVTPVTIQAVCLDRKQHAKS
ncbi:hypothetical protein GGX14DRAFT_392889 [Mycena pura]|uniref:Uncharacterized protein n=1 Tax=Mycena pura TaxID=153505 RepID=A0AAD6VIU7_9AGAR|nr:hypothetical protein GGX14DRAFT_392889 [Mycena pura]